MLTYHRALTTSETSGYAHAKVSLRSIAGSWSGYSLYFFEQLISDNDNGDKALYGERALFGTQKSVE